MQPLGWYVNRLRAMSPAEIGGRVGRQVRFALERAGFFRPRPPEPAVDPTVDLRWPVPAQVDTASYLAVADRILRSQFEFFGERFDLSGGIDWNRDPKTGVVAPLSFGKTLNYRDQAVVGDIKYLWEINRHLDLVPLAQAYALTGERRYLDGLKALLEGWLRQCPYPLGPNWCSSLELGIRLINWQFAFVLAGGAGSPLFDGSDGAPFRRDWLDAVYRHMHFIMSHLSAHSSANNHLIGELAGVFVAACAWPAWPEAQEWREKSQQLLVHQAAIQTHSDGVNKEQAVSYQQFVMYFLLVAGVVGERCGHRFPDAYWQGLRRMMAYVDALIDVNGVVPMIGDADDGIVFQLDRSNFDPFRALLPIGGRLFDDERWTARFPDDGATAGWFCDDMSPVLAPEAAPRRRDFGAGGYYLLGSGLGGSDEIRIIADAGPLGFLSIAAHGHADCLALTLSVAGRELLVDPGTYCYHSMRDWRDYFRSTAAHNTVRVDGEDQSVISGPFMWDRKAVPRVDVFESTDRYDKLRATHDGYTRLTDPVLHTREIRFDKASQVLEIIDEIECRSAHRVERFWHFAEGCSVDVDRGVVRAEADGAGVALTAEAAGREPRLFRGSTDPKGGWVSRRFGHKVPATTAVFADDIQGPTQLVTRIHVTLPSSRDSMQRD